MGAVSSGGIEMAIPPLPIHDIDIRTDCCGAHQFQRSGSEEGTLPACSSFKLDTRNTHTLTHNTSLPPARLASWWKVQSIKRERAHYY